MHQSLFFKLFPPPQFLLMPHAGVDISDDAISFIQYSRPVGARTIIKYGRIPLDVGIIEAGDIKDEAKLISVLTDLAHDQGISYAKLSIPEEKAYLFEIEIPDGSLNEISQHIEFKLEENIPLSAADAVFTFDLLPGDHGRPWRASVSAVPRTYIEHMMDLCRKANINPIAFETTPRAIARIVSYGDTGDVIVVHAMSRKTGVYVVSEHAVGFTSTIAAGVKEADLTAYTDTLADEVRRVHTYWLSKNENVGLTIRSTVVVGEEADSIVPLLRAKIGDIVPVDTVDVWRSVLDTSHYVPPIMKSDSFHYVSTAGLGL